jgi:hypothetical protein
LAKYKYPSSTFERAMKKKLFLVIMGLLLLSCGGFKKYKAPLLHVGWCLHYYEGECWNKVYSNLEGTYNIDSTGKLVRLSKKERMEELRDKAFKILLESPPDAPLCAVWVVYYKVKMDLARLENRPFFDPTIPIEPIKTKRVWN